MNNITSTKNRCLFSNTAAVVELGSLQAISGNILANGRTLGVKAEFSTVTQDTYSRSSTKKP